MGNTKKNQCLQPFLMTDHESWYRLLQMMLQRNYRIRSCITAFSNDTWYWWLYVTAKQNYLELVDYFVL